MTELIVTGQWIVNVPEEYKDKEEEYIKIANDWMTEDPIGFLSGLPTIEERLPESVTVSALKHKWTRRNNDSLQ